MIDSITSILRQVFTFRWKPNRDLVAVAISWLLVVGALYAANVAVGPDAGGGLPYFFLYAVLAATIFGIGVPLFWTVVVRRRPLSDLGITTRWLGLSIVLQLVFAGLQYLGTLTQVQLPPLEQLVPLIALSLAIGFFEAVFWRGWVLLRLEESLGIIPAILLASLLYAAYHIGYAMSLDEIAFLFLIGIMFAVVFRLTKSVFILWPLFQPMGQLVTLIRDGLTLPLISTLGFVEVLIAMLVLAWLAGRYYGKYREESGSSHPPTDMRRQQQRIRQDEGRLGHKRTQQEDVGSKKDRYRR
jgi:membrane protease YdiL (CAAX protease family)